MRSASQNSEIEDEMSSKTGRYVAVYDDITFMTSGQNSFMIAGEREA